MVPPQIFYKEVFFFHVKSISAGLLEQYEVETFIIVSTAVYKNEYTKCKITPKLTRFVPFIRKPPHVISEKYTSYYCYNNDTKQYNHFAFTRK